MENANKPQLPSLTRIDVEKAEDSYRMRSGPPSSLPSVTLASPTYPSGPPPPYSQPPTSHYTNNWSGPQAGVHTPPESRRTSGDTQDGTKHTLRQSLPSISEALGVNSKASFSSSTSGRSPTSTYQSHPQSTVTSSPQRIRHDDSYSSATSNPSYPPLRRSPQQDQERTVFDRPPHHAQPASAPTPPASTYSYHNSPAMDGAQSQRTMAPPVVPYGYQPYPPRYAQPPPPTSAPSGPIYQPSLSCPSPKTPSGNWKADGVPSRFGQSEQPAGYGHSVKRQLDLFDFEAALNDIAQSSGMMTNFSRHYGDRMHETARTGATVQQLPDVVEIDEMISKSRSQMDAFMKMREVIIAQRAAYEQQAVDRQHHHKSYSDMSSAQHMHPIDSEDQKGDTPNSDTKKRRGRAAPPGRCHSCNRAETPEWRRGPDGARTLCNACGLHYAKLTRKQQGANKAPAFRSSNLRPKEG